jgi:heavy metal sensor kinase
LKNTSLSLRLAGWFSAIFLGGFALFGVVMWLDLAYSLAQGRDRTLTRRAARITELLDATGGDPDSAREVRFEQLTDVMSEGNLIEVLDSSGKLVLPRDQKAPDFPWPTLTGLPTRDQFGDVDYNGRVFRLYRHPRHPYVILVAGQLEDNRNMMARFAAGLAWATPAMLGLCALAGYFLNRRALQPVDQITAMLRSISIGNLSQRLPVANTRDELQRLAETCNEMLARLEDAVERINRFTADASHELRSPVALIRTVAEYALRNPKIDAESREAFEEILAESVETSQLLEDMLTLARADAGYGSTVFEAVDLSQVVEDAAARQRPLAEAKQQTVTVRTSGPAWISGDRSSLRRLVWILLDNAVKYTPAKGSIAVGLMATASEAVLTVRDSGIGIPEELLPHIFDRFVRADPSRGEVNGTGLGLAIAKWIAGAHRAKLSVQSREREGSVFRVEFTLLHDAE